MISVTEVLSWIGAVTGVGGLVTSVAAFRRAATLKAIDLRIEVRTLASVMQSAIADLPKLVDHACASRTAVLAAIGLVQSSAAKLWNDQVAADRLLVAQIAIPIEQNYSRYSHQALEDELVALRAVRHQVDAIRDRYLAALASDDKERDRLKEAAAARLRQSN